LGKREVIILCPIRKLNVTKVLELKEAVKLDNVEYLDESIHEHNEEIPTDDALRELMPGELSALFSNLSKGCEKQYRPEEAELFLQLSNFYEAKCEPVSDESLEDLVQLVNEDLANRYLLSYEITTEASDRGALRALVWGEKVTKILTSIFGRYEKLQDALLDHKHIYVCEICGFVYIGDKLPELCPICKVQKDKLTEIKRG